jgi:hypothetical protein
MSVGSSFDAYAKSFIYERFYGKKDPAFEFQTIFESQVEPQNRDFALPAGKYCFECYRKYGSLADLMLELDAASEAPRMEFTVEGRIAHDNCVDGVPLSGKPDIYFKTKEGAHVIYDWKVNGYCSNSNTSPAKGYIMIRGEKDSFRGLNQGHKESVTMRDRGIMLNVGMFLEHVKDDWANQLAIYGWLLGESVGGDFIVGIDQLVFANPGHKCRVASHRCKISPAYQKEWFSKVAWVWQVIESGHIFRDVSLEVSMNRQRMLDSQFEAYKTQEGGDQLAEDWFREITRKHRDY